MVSEAREALRVEMGETARMGTTGYLLMTSG